MVDLDKLERLNDARTPGEWRWDPDACEIDSAQDEGTHIVSVATPYPTNDSGAYIVIEPQDAAAIIAAVNALGPLLAEVRQLRANAKSAHR